VYIVATPRSRQSGLGTSGASADQYALIDRNAEPDGGEPGDLRRLVEPSLCPARGMQRHRHQQRNATPVSMKLQCA